MKLIEIIPAYFTAHATTERCRQLVTALGKRDVVCRATPGFIVNRMARPTTEGFRLLEEHGARAADRPCPQGRRALSYGVARADRFLSAGHQLSGQSANLAGHAIRRAIPPATYSVRWSMPVYWEKNGRSYFAVEENAPPVMAATDADIETLHVYGEHPFYPVTTTCRASVATAARGTTAGITGPAGRPDQ